MFPNGWPGCGLLLLRVVVFSLSAYETIGRTFEPTTYIIFAREIIATICAVALLLGAATPLMAIVFTLCEIFSLFWNSANWPLSIALGGVALAIAMLGPGATSIDARRYGRERIDLPQ